MLRSASVFILCIWTIPVDAGNLYGLARNTDAIIKFDRSGNHTMINADPFPGYYPIAPHLTATDPNAGIVYVLARRNLTENMFLVAMDVHTGELVRNERIKDIIDPGDEIGLEVSL
jgi:hypothetical protein